MWKTLLITVILLMIATPAFAITQDEIDLINAELEKIAVIPIETPTDKKGWNQYDTTLLVLRSLDWLQTRDIATRPRDIISVDGTYYQFEEYNPILGKHPSLEQVNTYFIVLIGTDILISKYASPKIKKWWRIINITTETYLVIHNVQVGIKFKF